MRNVCLYWYTVCMVYWPFYLYKSKVCLDQGLWLLQYNKNNSGIGFNFLQCKVIYYISFKSL